MPLIEEESPEMLKLCEEYINWMHKNYQKEEKKKAAYKNHFNEYLLHKIPGEDNIPDDVEKALWTIGIQFYIF